MATFDAHKNFAISSVSSAPIPPQSGTTMLVVDGTQFPSVAPFNITVWPTATQPTSANAEILRVTARSGNTLTIVRTQEGSGARPIVIGDQVALTITTKIITDIETALSSISTDGGTFSGAVNGTTGTFSGALNGTTGTFSGSVHGSTGVFSSALSATTGAFSGTVTAPTFSGGNFTGTTGTFSGTITGVNEVLISGTALTPITTSGSDSAASALVASFSTSSGRGVAIHMSDATTFNSAIGVTSTGGFAFWSNRSPGVAGTAILQVTTGGAMTLGGSGSISASSGSFGNSLSAGTGSFTGAVTSAAQGSRFGGSNGSYLGPLRTNTNLLVYDNGATNWSGIGADTTGDMYFVTGISGSPSTAMRIGSGGSLAQGSVAISNALTVGTSLGVGTTLSVNAGSATFIDAIPLIRGYQERWQSMSSSTTTNIDIVAGNHVILNLVADISTFNFSSSVFGFQGNYVQPVVLHIVGNGVAHSINWTVNGIGVRFSSGVAPTLVASNGLITRVVIYYMAGYAIFGEQIGYNA